MTRCRWRAESFKVVLLELEILPSAARQHVRSQISLELLQSRAEFGAFRDDEALDDVLDHQLPLLVIVLHGVGNAFALSARQLNQMLLNQVVDRVHLSTHDWSSAGLINNDPSM